MKSDDVGSLIAALNANKKNISYRQGTVVAVDRAAKTNTVRVGKALLENLTLLNVSSTIILPGDHVGLLCVKSQVFILGKIGVPGDGLYTYWVGGTMSPGADQWQTWPSTISTTGQELLGGTVIHISAAIAFEFSTYVGPNSTGVFTLEIDGVEVANSGTYTGGTAGAIGFFTGFADWPASQQLGTLASVSLRAQRLTGTDKLAATFLGLRHAL